MDFKAAQAAKSRILELIALKRWEEADAQSRDLCEKFRPMNNDEHFFGNSPI
jgi:hypothetical protein